MYFIYTVRVFDTQYVNYSHPLKSILKNIYMIVLILYILFQYTISDMVVLFYKDENMILVDIYISNFQLVKIYWNEVKYQDSSPLHKSAIF